LIDGGNESRNQVMSSLQLNVDITPGCIDPVATANQAIVKNHARNSEENQRRKNNLGHGPRNSNIQISLGHST
jgi:hypothetical protein